MSALSFSFENNPITVVLKDGEPWFVASEVTKALNLSNPTVALRTLRDVERAKIIINGRDTNVVRESGLYTLILRSQDAIKEGTAAFRFRVKVTDEILPEIRRTGRYECPVAATLTIDAAQQLAVKKAVARRAKAVAVHYQTIYRALYDRFQVPRYTELLRSDFDDAIHFIETCEIRPQIETASRIPEGAVVLTREEAQTFLNVAYVVKYLFRPQYKIFAQLLNAVRSPMTGAFWDAFNDLAVTIMEQALERHGLRIEDMDCYKALTR